MSYCLKTGGILVDESNECHYECDLHVVGNCLVAVTCEPQYDIPDLSRVTARIKRGSNPFVRQSTPFGVLVVPLREVYPSRQLKEHIAMWYTGLNLKFAED